MKGIKQIVFIVSILFAVNSYPADETEIILPLHFDKGSPLNSFPTVTIQIQNKKLPLVFDTGALHVSLALSKSVLNGLQVGYTSHKFCGYSFSERMCMEEFIVPEVKLDNFVMKGVRGGEMPYLWGKKSPGFDDTEAAKNGVIGLGLLNQFGLLIDYSKHIVILTPDYHLPTEYEGNNWMIVPFENPGFTDLYINSSRYKFGWDTGAIPSIIRLLPEIKDQAEPCPPDKAYNVNDCHYLNVNSLALEDGQSFPQTWFLLTKFPNYFKFDGLFGANFFEKHVVFFNFSHHEILISEN